MGVAQCGTTSKETEERKHEENKEVDNGTGAGEGKPMKGDVAGGESQSNEMTWGLKQPMKCDDMGTKRANEMRRHGDSNSQ